MAYNPFNIFRRNQRAIFAVVTVFIMFTFVLSSGLGGGADFFDWLPRWLGSKSKKGDVICTIDGNKVYQSELDQLRFQRVIANRYMSQGAANSQAALDHYVQEHSVQMSPEAGRLMDRVNQQQGLLALSPQQLMQFGTSHPIIFQGLRAALDGILELPSATSLDKDLARVKLVSLTLLQSLYTSAGNQQYFSNLPNRTNRDLVDFLIWQKKADQLGISFSNDDVKKMIEKEFYDFFLAQAQVRVQKDLSQSINGFNMNRCIEAIGEEFRVRTAQIALLGPAAHGSRRDKTFGGFPSFSPAYEIYDYYREQCSPTNYGAIPVPAINFLDKVPPPDESNHAVQAELNELFRKYMNDEPNFGREAPGFKIPRKIRVNYISASANDPYYVKKAEQTLKDELWLARTRASMVVPLMGLSPAKLFDARALAIDPILDESYEATVLQHKLNQRDQYGTANLSVREILSTSVVRPGVMASTAGAMAGQMLTLGNPFAAAAEAASAPFAYETRDRVQAGVPAVLLTLGGMPGVGSEIFGTVIGKPVPGPLPGPALFAGMMNGAAAYSLMLPKPLPLDALRAELTTKLFADKAKQLVKEDLDAFIKEVNKLSNDGKVRPSEKDKIAAIQKYIAEFTDGPRFDSVLGLGLGLAGFQKNLPGRGIKVGGNKVAQSEWTLEEDPDLATLVAVQKESLRASPHRNFYIPFASSFFWQAGNRNNPASTIYQPSYYPEQPSPSASSLEVKPQYVVWRSEEVPAKLAASYDAAKPAVIAAWKRIKAREMAKKRAEEIANSLRSGTPAALSFAMLDESNKLATEFADNPKSQNRIVPFQIEGVCPLTTVANPTASKGLFSATPSSPFSQLTPFDLPPSENVKYPSVEMYRELLAKRKEPPKTTMVLADEPKDIYYVVTLFDRKEKSDLEYQSAVMTTNSLGGVRNIVLGSFAQDAQQKTLASVMGLLKKEFNYEETEEQKKKLDERRSSEQ